MAAATAPGTSDACILALWRAGCAAQSLARVDARWLVYRPASPTRTSARRDGTSRRLPEDQVDVLHGAVVEPRTDAPVPAASGLRAGPVELPLATRVRVRAAHRDGVAVHDLVDRRRRGAA